MQLFLPMLAFPCFDCAWMDLKQWMAFRRANRVPMAVKLDVAYRKFAQQVSPLVLNLTRRDQDGLVGPCHRYFRSIERVSANAGLGPNSLEVRADCRNRRALSTKAFELRVSAIPPRIASQNGLRQKALPPQRYKALWIEILGVQGPKAHRA